MFGFLKSKKTFADCGLLKGATDNHSHILWGLDDGVKTREETLSILAFLESLGLKTLWLTPHTMEDVPNTTEGLKARFDELRGVYHGTIELRLASEYMIDTLFEKRLEDRDLLTHGRDTVLVETSTWAPPIDLWDILERMMKYGYRPMIAHPERYRYMTMEDYERLKEMGTVLQLNLPSILGSYGEGPRMKAQMLLDKGFYTMVGSDCHRSHAIKKQYSEIKMKESTLEQLKQLMLA